MDQNSSKLPVVPGGGRLFQSRSYLALLSWATAASLLAIALFLFDLEAPAWPLGWRLALGILVLGLLGGLIYVGLSQIIQQRERQQTLMHQLEKSDRQIAQAYQRLGAVFQISQKFTEARDEPEIINLVLRACVDLLGAAGASFVPLDERGQPMTAFTVDKEAFPVPEAWLEYLASPVVRERCQGCEKHGMIAAQCPLLTGPFAQTKGIYCLPLIRGEREFGVFSLYLPDRDGLDPEAQAFLRSLMGETALALEGARLRQRELDTFSQLQAVRQKNDRSALIAGLLQNAVESLDADYAVVLGAAQANFPGEVDTLGAEAFSFGEIPPEVRPRLEEIARKVVETHSPVMQSGENSDPLGAVLAVALDADGNGALIVAYRTPHVVRHRQLVLVQAIANQISQALQNSRQMARLEYQTMMEERTRLAREIHDGLAQTLGYLKLQMAQMQSYLERGDQARLKQTMDSSYNVLAEAYQDARYAIDGLRIFPSGSSMGSWMQQVIREFQENLEPGMELALHTEISLKAELPTEIQAQLIRILQEALNNIRKHAQAKNVWIQYSDCPEEVVLEVRDDGLGFDPQDVTDLSQHGLKGMHERAELIGANLEVASQPRQGTTVRVRLQTRPREVAI